MQLRYKQRGTLLVSALFLIIVVVAFVNVLSRMLSTSSHSNIIEYYGSMALLTARSGIEWQLNQIFSPQGRHTLTVYQIVKGDSRWPHGGGLEVAIAGAIIIEDTNGESDYVLDDFSQHGSPEVDPVNTDDQKVLASSVDYIKEDDIIDSRYSHKITSSDDKSLSTNIYFLATNQGNNYGHYFVSEDFIEPNVIYYFDGYTHTGTVAYSTLYVDTSTYVDISAANSCQSASEKPEFIHNAPYMSHCSVDVSCELIKDFQDSNSVTSALNIYRIASTATCDAGRFSTVRTIYVDAKTL